MQYIYLELEMQCGYQSLLLSLSRKFCCDKTKLSLKMNLSSQCSGIIMKIWKFQLIKSVLYHMKIATKILQKNHFNVII